MKRLKFKCTTVEIEISEQYTQGGVVQKASKEEEEDVAMKGKEVDVDLHKKR